MSRKPLAIEHICPHCGVLEDKKPFVGEHCIDCTLKRERKSWPSEMELTRCPKCGNLWREREWKKVAPSLITALIDEKMERAGLEGHYNMEAQVWEGVFTSAGAKIPYRHPLKIAYKNMQCTTCERSSGNYHEAIIQLRGDPIRVERARKRLIRRIEQKTFIAKVEPMHGGVDIFVGIKKDIEVILRREGHKFVRTEKLVGQREGQRLYRSTFLLRLEKPIEEQERELGQEENETKTEE